MEEHTSVCTSASCFPCVYLRVRVRGGVAVARPPRGMRRHRVIIHGTPIKALRVLDDMYDSATSAQRVGARFFFFDVCLAFSPPFIPCLAFSPLFYSLRIHSAFDVELGHARMHARGWRADLSTRFRVPVDKKKRMFFPARARAFRFVLIFSFPFLFLCWCVGSPHAFSLVRGCEFSLFYACFRFLFPFFSFFAFHAPFSFFVPTTTFSYPFVLWTSILRSVRERAIRVRTRARSATR